MERLLTDLRHAARSWLNDPAVATAALVTLVLGISTTIAIFSVVDAVLLRPLPYKDPSTLVRVAGLDPGDPDAGVRLEDFQALQTAPSFEAIAVYYRGERVSFTELKEPIRKTAPPIPPAARARVVRKAKPDHPWRQGYQNMKPRVPNPVIAAPLVGIPTYASP